MTTTASVVRSRPGAVTGQSVLGGRTSTEYSLGADASWEADVWGRVRQTVAAGTATGQAAAADLENTRLSLGAELAADYFQLRSFDAELALFEQTIDAFQRAATLTRNQYNAGIVSRADVEQAETQLASAQAQATDVRLERVQIEHAIAVLAGEPPSSLSLAPMPLDGEPPATPIELPSLLLERRPDIAAAERRVAAANAQVGVASAAFFPAITLGASGGFRGDAAPALAVVADAVLVGGPGAGPDRLRRRRAARRRKRTLVAAYDESVGAYRQTVLAAFQDVEDNLAAERLLAQEASELARRGRRRATLPRHLSEPVPGWPGQLSAGGDATDRASHQSARCALGDRASFHRGGAARAGAGRRMEWGSGRRGPTWPTSLIRYSRICSRRSRRHRMVCRQRPPSGGWPSVGQTRLARHPTAVSPDCCCGSSDLRSCCC